MKTKVHVRVLISSFLKAGVNLPKIETCHLKEIIILDS